MAEQDVAQEPETENEAPIVENEAPALVDQKTGEVLDIAAMGQKLSTMKKGMEITGEYIEFEEGKEVNVYVIGLSKMTALDGDEKIDAIRMLTEDGRFVINADAVVRSTLHEHAKVGKPVPVSILCTGKAGPVGRQYKTFKIHPLALV